MNRYEEDDIDALAHFMLLGAWIGGVVVTLAFAAWVLI